MANLDAPRRWFLEATRTLKQLGLRQHCLGPYLFMLYETDFLEEQATSTDLVVGSDRLCGLICIHVDDLPSSTTYQKMEARLKEAFNFREWHDTETMECCGANLNHTEDGWKLSHEHWWSLSVDERGETAERTRVYATSSCKAGESR